MQVNINKKIISYIQSLSAKTLGTTLAISFVSASLLSLAAGYLMVPTDGKMKRVRVKRADVLDDKGGLTKDDQNAIIERNIFNSEGKTGDSTLITETTKKRPNDGNLVKSDLPYKIKGLIFAGDPFNGLALLENTQRRRTKSYVVGDQVQGGATLVEIYETRVIFDRGGQREYLEVEKFELVRSRRKKSGKTSSPKMSKIATRPPSETHKEDGFERKGTEITISEEFKRSLLAPDNLTKILQDAKAEPNMVNGELKGFRLTRIRENSVYEKAGFQNNDIVEEINGIPLRDAAGAIRLLQQMKNAKEIEVRLQRAGVSMDMNVTIQ